MAQLNELPVSIKHRKTIDSCITRILNMYSTVSTFLDQTNATALNKVLASQRILMIAIIGISRHRVTSWADALEYFFGADWPTKAEHFGIPSALPQGFFENLALGITELVNIAEFESLFPYIAEGFEYVLSHGEAVIGKKRAKGIYYTPHDVASYLVDETLGEYLRRCIAKKPDTSDIHRKMQELSILDPACGSGVFLLECLNVLVEFNREFVGALHSDSIIEALSHLYGVDSSYVAVDSCRFILVYKSIMYEGFDATPYEIWRVVSTRILQADSMLTPIQDGGSCTLSIDEQTSQLGETNGNQIELPLFGDRRSFENMFPQVFGTRSGFKIIVGNPPYAPLDIEQRAWLHQLGYKSVTHPSLSSNTYMVFIEKMLQLADPNSAKCSLVVPLSIAYDRGKNTTELRKLIESTPGVWRFAHFDRSPDSLFGDHVKTRSTILFFERNADTKRIYTSRLHRWNSRQRQSLFRNITFVRFPGSIRDDGLPRIGGELGLDIYLRFEKLAKLDLAGPIRCLHNKELINLTSRETLIYAYGTAYNWIPVFRRLPRSFDGAHEPYIPSTLWGIECSSPKIADMLYACLSSRYSYLLWTMFGDGFHFASTLLRKLPFHTNNFTGPQIESLSRLGHKLNTEAQAYVMFSHNAGKVIGNYNMVKCDATLREIDLALTKAFGLSDEHLRYVEVTYYDHICAGRTAFKHAEALARYYTS
ncbi:hypothetical protein GCM10025857_07680 [Alicyclobacillus contaminans]|uniref:Eco57I restriction-modification methylase domain-containing protein n=1 Tax=Alicyclobacillus contaminans TaxID=392016 RepID=UPI0004120989|nr:N-6 DNA methylase [Alicyclobacillus contaminans]GMA49411.1 hypothetical protein GCM10025857_07680 [Alicyclobacillus contaminans]